ncbi:BLUF domain-containing protein [Rheinheimera sp. UJ51]|uniref:BLUF domain-containing protein n=1 Tax=Rheinheimera sp. UJ51 TaxID=2892446 RepID=UPI001E462160|nr:BLUF domain-containing protein [Rheinheimera sp. UJ51]MCC5450135.1 BLUF domain-containing protein [Rheinheimera sp. UJ51]
MPEQPLLQLAYVSTAQTDITADCIAEIHQQAERNNRLHQITGLLLATEQHFLQLLEGPKRDVELTYARIQRDKRHHHVRLIFKHGVTERQFPEWHMGLRRSFDQAQQDVTAIVNLYGQRSQFSAQHGAALVLLLSSL